MRVNRQDTFSSCFERHVKDIGSFKNSALISQMHNACNGHIVDNMYYTM